MAFEASSPCALLAAQTSLTAVLPNALSRPACLQKLCDVRGFKTVRIDGSTDVSKRQDVVNAFNSYGVGQVGSWGRRPRPRQV